jgi:capsular exopolysaccharide synthesis family protein
MVRLRREIEAARNHLDNERLSVYNLVLGSAESDYLAARNEEEALNQALEQEKTVYHELSLKEIQYDNRNAEIADKRETLGALIRRQSETDTSGTAPDTAASNIRIVDRAEVPTKPSSPKTRLNTILGVFAGIVIGLSLAFFLEYLDLSIKTPEEVYRTTGLGTIGTIPAVRPVGGRSARRDKTDTGVGGRMELISHEDNWSVPSEAFRKMRTALLVSQASGPPRTILVTSSQPGEGKTSISLNLAITLAQMGRRVLLVDSDLRKPRQHKFLGVPNEIGLSTYLSSTEIPVLQPVPTGIEHLDLIPSGPTPPNPSDLLDSERLVNILSQLGAQAYDHILLDSPPVLAVADPAILASRVEGVVVVVHAGATKKEALQQAIDRLRQVKAKILGVALNHMEPGSGSYYGYAYEAYGERKDSKPLASVTRLRRK